MDGEVGHDGEGGAVEEEEGALQGQQVHVWPEVRALRGSKIKDQREEYEDEQDCRQEELVGSLVLELFFTKTLREAFKNVLADFVR